MEAIINSLNEGARRAMRGVVQVQVHGYDDDNVQSILDPRFLAARGWGGSGFLIRVDGVDGYVLTNAHVVRNAINLQVLSLLTSERTFTAELVGAVVRQEPDIALLRIVPEELEEFRRICGGEIPYVEFGDSEAIERGREIKAIGYPFGMGEPNVSGGEISNFVAGDEISTERLVTDAAINPGNSGGPAIIHGGVAVGINTSIIINADNIGFVTPINYAKLLLPQLISHGEARLAHPGTRFQPNSAANARYLGQEHAEGVIAIRVYKGGMFDAAGIQRLDVITQIDDLRFDLYGNVVSPDSYRKRNIYDVVRHIAVGKPVTVHYWRGNATHRAVVDAMPAPQFGVDMQPLVARRRYIELQGMILQELSYELIGAISSQLGGDYMAEIEDRYSQEPKLAVTFIIPGSPADDVFFSPGNIITRVNQRPVHRLEDLVGAMRDDNGGQPHRVIIETQQGQLGVFHLSDPELSRLRVEYAVPHPSGD